MSKLGKIWEKLDSYHILMVGFGTVIFLVFVWTSFLLLAPSNERKQDILQEISATWKPAPRMLYKITGQERVTAVSTALDQPEITLWIYNEQDTKFEIIEYQFVQGKGWYKKKAFIIKDVKISLESITKKIPEPELKIEKHQGNGNPAAKPKQGTRHSK